MQTTLKCNPAGSTVPTHKIDPTIEELRDRVQDIFDANKFHDLETEIVWAKPGKGFNGQAVGLKGGFSYGKDPAFQVILSQLDSSDRELLMFATFYPDRTGIMKVSITV